MKNSKSNNKTEAPPPEFDEVLKRMLSTPPKPHKKPEKPTEPAKKEAKKKTAN